MSASITKLLGDQPLMKIVRGLFNAPEPPHLRALANDYKLSPAGVSDILRRLSEAGLLHEVRIGNRRCFSLILKDSERGVLGAFFRAYEHAFVEQRAPRFSKGALRKLAWMDETLEFYQEVKKRRRRETT